MKKKYYLSGNELISSNYQVVERVNEKNVYSLYRKYGEIILPKLKEYMEKMLLTPNQFMLYFGGMNSKEIYCFLGREKIDSFIRSCCIRKDVDTLKEFIRIFGLNLTQKSEKELSRAEEAIEKTLELIKLKSKKGKRNDIFLTDTPCGSIRAVNQGERITLVIYQISPAGQVSSVILER